MNCRIALAQVDSAPGNVEGNVEIHLRMALRAADAGSALVAFPELSLTGYSVKDLNFDLAMNPEKPPAALKPLLDVSSRISLLVGGIEEDSSHRIYNAAFLIEDGSVRSVHRKVYPPTYGMFEELRYFSPGRAVNAFRSKHGQFGALICEDLWHLPLPYLLSQQGVGAIIGLVASPARVTDDQHELSIAVANSENHRAYARLLSTYILFCNRIGFEDGVSFWGASEIVAPDGSVLSVAKQFETDMIFGTLEESLIRRARHSSRHFLDDDPRLLLHELSRLFSPANR